MSSVSEFYRGRSVLVTGASGFIGKQLVEKLLRSCPDIDKIYVLLRGTRFYNPPDRLQYILSSPVCLSVCLCVCLYWVDVRSFIVFTLVILLSKYLRRRLACGARRLCVCLCPPSRDCTLH